MNLIAEVPIELKSDSGEVIRPGHTFNVWDDGTCYVFGLAFEGRQTAMQYSTSYIDVNDFPHAGLEWFFFDVGRGLYCERAELERVIDETGLRVLAR